MINFAHKTFDDWWKATDPVGAYGSADKESAREGFDGARSGTFVPSIPLENIKPLIAALGQITDTDDWKGVAKALVTAHRFLDKHPEAGAVPLQPYGDVTKAGKSWDDVVRLSEGREAVDTFVGHGISRSWSDRELFVDFGDELGPFSAMQLVFRDPAQAQAAYCTGLRVEVKTTAHPEHDLP